MKVSPISLRLTLTLGAAFGTFCALAISDARAQADLTFSGGLGMPLTLALDTPVTYTVTTASSDDAPQFDFQGVGNFFSDDYIVTGNITFAINGGDPQDISFLQSGSNVGSVATEDARISDSEPGVEVGDVVVLSAGTLTTRVNYPGAPPAGGSFETFLFDGSGTKLDLDNGVAAPEPSTWALVGIGAGGLSLAMRRRSARGAWFARLRLRLPE